MPGPQRARGAGDEHKQDTVTKEKSNFPPNASVVTKARRGGYHIHAKDTVVLPFEADPSYLCHDGHNGLDWSKMDTSILNAYRRIHRLELPPAFGSGFNERILGRAGVCRRSPTMIRHKARRKTTKEQMVLAVKKDFNDAMINELDSITTFLYSIHNKDKSFRMHFPV
ncbi:MAG: hypothetical protein Q9168_004717 [Polycauliona sp. 1 TL-2023]